MPPLAAAALSPSASAATLLMVDDDAAMHVLLEQALAPRGYDLIHAHTGEEGLDLLAKHHDRVDAIVLDRSMPGLDGLEVVARLKNDLRLAGIPVVMLTGVGEPEAIEEGINAGVYYYLIKSIHNPLLESVVGAAVRESRQKRSLMFELARRDAVLESLSSCHLSVRTLAEAEEAACFLASCFPEPERAVSGLMELITNAIEHGNLGIACEEKQRLLADNRWQEEVARRLALPEHADKHVDIMFQRKDGHCLVQITDCGHGFDWKRYWHINPGRATSGNGRGIARARLMAFDRMSYNEKGNSVTVMAGSTGDYAW